MSAFPVPITAVFAGLLALMLVGLSIRVTVLRAKKKINLFDGSDPEMGRAIRVQGNFVEYVPMALALIGLVEWIGVKPWVVYLFGIALLIARVSHAWGIYSSAFPARAIGTTINWIVLAAAGLLIIGLVV